VHIQLRDGRVRYQDSNGAQSEWIGLPAGLGAPLDWGFFSRNDGLQGRLTIKRVKVTAP
jgi:hypothetical protein